ncbi:hypothetical protein NKDENANG_00242 [Candidatus Entotheonellaceae bacterium PAL068K]
MGHPQQASHAEFLHRSLGQDSTAQRRLLGNGLGGFGQDGRIHLVAGAIDEIVCQADGLGDNDTAGCAFGERLSGPASRGQEVKFWQMVRVRIVCRGLVLL